MWVLQGFKWLWTGWYDIKNKDECVLFAPLLNSHASNRWSIDKSFKISNDFGIEISWKYLISLGNIPTILRVDLVIIPGYIGLHSRDTWVSITWPFSFSDTFTIIWNMINAFLYFLVRRAMARRTKSCSSNSDEVHHELKSPLGFKSD